MAGAQTGPLPVLSNDSLDAITALSQSLLDRSPEKAYTLGMRALEGAQQKGYKPGVANAMLTLGLYYQDQAKYNTALEYLNGSRRLFTELGDTLMIARSIRHLGNLYRQRALYPEAEQYYQEALSMGRRHNYSPIIANSLKDLGGLAYYLQEHEKAMAYFEQSLLYLNATADPVAYASVLNNLGVVHKAAGKYPAALATLQEAYQLFEQQQSVRNLSVVLMNMGETQQRMGQLDEAEINYLKALKAARKVNNIQRLVEAYQYLAEFYAELEQFEQAYAYKERYAAYKDTLYRQEANAQMAEMAKKLEIERKERAFSELIQGKEMEILSKENEITQLELYRKNNLMILFVMLVIMALAVSFILYKSYRTKRQQNQQLADQNQQIIQKNQQLQEMNQKLQLSEKQLKELNDTKDKFFSILAHDLRSPLVTLKSFVQLLHEGHSRFTEAEMHRLTGRIERSLHSLTDLLDNLLQWSTTQSGLIKFSPRRVRLQKLVEENLQLLESTALAKEIKLGADLQVTHAYADSHMLHLILRNLMGNALKFTQRKGRIQVRVSEQEGYTCIQVEDTGIGMAPEVLQRLREEKLIRSCRGTENEKGSGLGLMLCKEFVEQHNGYLAVDSEEGVGTTFTVCLPKQPTTAVQQAEVLKV